MKRIEIKERYFLDAPRLRTYEEKEELSRKRINELLMQGKTNHAVRMNNYLHALANKKALENSGKNNSKKSIQYVKINYRVNSPYGFQSGYDAGYPVMEEEKAKRLVNELNKKEKSKQSSEAKKRGFGREFYISRLATA